jgi:hypothetical protein
VLGRPVHIRIWIHFLIRDTHGNNQWVSHYNISGKLKRPYRDRKYSFADMANVDPDCVYIWPEEIAPCISVSDAVKTKAGREDPMKAISEHNVKMDFCHDCVPLSDPIHGVYKILPLDGLNTTAESTSLYIFESITGIIGKSTEDLHAATCIKRVFLKLHHPLSRRGYHLRSVKEHNHMGLSTTRKFVSVALCSTHYQHAEGSVSNSEKKG